MGSSLVMQPVLAFQGPHAEHAACTEEEEEKFLPKSSKQADGAGGQRGSRRQLKAGTHGRSQLAGTRRPTRHHVSATGSSASQRDWRSYLGPASIASGKQ